MAADHYVPAALIGRFSLGEEERARRRQIWVARRGKAKPYTQVAENVGYRPNLYGEDVDRMWAASEQLMPQAIDEFVATGQMNDLWLVGMVPMIANIFVRGAEFESRYGDRLEAQGLGAFRPRSRDDRDGIRVMERQRLLAPVMYSEWHIVRFAPGDRLITSDVAHVPQMLPDGRTGYAIPVGLDVAVCIVPTGRRERDETGLSFGANQSASVINAAIAYNAIDEVYCPTEALAEQALRDFQECPPPTSHREPAAIFGYSGAEVREIEHDWQVAIGMDFLSPTPPLSRGQRMRRWIRNLPPWSE